MRFAEMRSAGMRSAGMRSAGMRSAGMRFGAAVCCAAMGLAGCASATGGTAGGAAKASASPSASATGSKQTPTADLPAGTVLQRARAAGAAATSFTMAFTDTPDPADPDQLPLTAHLSWDRAGHCVGQVSLTGRGSAELLVSGGTTWLKPDARFARAEFGAAGAAMLAGKYLKGPTTDRHFADVSMTTDEYQKNLCQAGVVTLSIPDEDDQLSTKVGPATVGGVPTVDILPDGKGTTDTFIAAEGTPYVIQSGKQGGIAFTGYGKPVAFQLPPANQTVDVSRLPRG
jgi:hypothetical protein